MQHDGNIYPRTIANFTSQVSYGRKSSCISYIFHIVKKPKVKLKGVIIGLLVDHKTGSSEFFGFIA